MLSYIVIHIYKIICYHILPYTIIIINYYYYYIYIYITTDINIYIITCYHIYIYVIILSYCLTLYYLILYQTIIYIYIVYTSHDTHPTSAFQPQVPLKPVPLPDCAKWVKSFRSSVAPKLSELDTNMYFTPCASNSRGFRGLVVSLVGGFRANPPKR